MWRALEPYHVVTYFAPESKEATSALGCKGGWMSYFGLCAAPLGAVPVAVVTSAFFSFHPDGVSRAVPAVWELASPSDYLAARAQSLDVALRRLLGDVVHAPELAEAAGLARETASAAPIAGRPLAEANTALDWPSDPHPRLWQAQTPLRESRGDGHIAVLVSVGLHPCEALVAFASDGVVGDEALRRARGWSEAEWAATSERLAERRLLDRAGSLTEEGAALRSWVEGTTPTWRRARPGGRWGSSAVNNW
jgi:hypothetical protein